ncbi:MAG: hypothetical protein ACFFCI_14105 [Promethearchaeota archaeon]
MRFKSKKKIVIAFFGIIFVLLIASKFNYIYDYENSEKSREFIEKKDLRVAAQGINLLSPEHKKYFGPMSGYYPGTYGFEDTLNGQEPPQWNPGPTSDWRIVEEFNGHRKVYECYDRRSTTTQYFTAGEQDNGTVEFWVANQNTESAFMHCRLVGDDPLAMISIGRNSWFSYWEGTGWYNTTVHAINNKWYHIRFDFETTIGSYMGLGQYKWNVYIDGTQFGPFNLAYNQTPYRFSTWSNFFIANRYLDAVSYSWDPYYSIGDNLQEGFLLNYESSINFNWMGYSLDNQANRTITGNTTFSLPDCGKHTIQVYGIDSLGDVSESELRKFYVFNSWKPDGNPICTAADYQYSPEFCSDGVGGMIITWEDYRSGSAEIYAQRIDSYGNILWGTNGVPISSYIDHQYSPKICSDGSGGAIITWYDYSNGVDTNINVQRIDANGNIQWGYFGIIICWAAGDQRYPKICSDGVGGAIVVWQDPRGASTDIYGQRVDAEGNILWADNGVPVCTASGNQYYPEICSDGAGGVVVTWRDYRGSSADLYAQKVDANGVTLWSADGEPVCTADGSQLSHNLCTDGLGGAIITWYDSRNSLYYDIYAQRIDFNGVPIWGGNGTGICTESGYQYYPEICSDESLGAFITWQDRRSGNNYDIYAQRINAVGTIQWAANGTAICTESGNQANPKICIDKFGGAIITWQDLRNGFDQDIYLQWIGANGYIKWTANGTAINTELGAQLYPEVRLDDYGGAFIIWTDSRSSTYDIYAQHIKKIELMGEMPNIEINMPENTSYTAPMNGFYPATYSFDSEAIGEPQPMGFNNLFSTDCSGEVISEIGGHKNVFSVYDNNNSGAAMVMQRFNDDGFQNQTHGTIEFWYRVTSTNVITQFRLNWGYGVNDVSFMVRIGGTGHWEHNNGTWNKLPNIADPLSLTWYHIKVNFRCQGAPSYLGLGVNQYEVVIDGVSSGALSFYDPTTELAMFMPLYTAWGSYGGNYAYSDAIGYSWDENYNIGDNLKEGLLLDFKISDSLCWIGYLLDGDILKRIFGNISIPLPEEGFHTIQIAGYDSFWRKCETEQIRFLVDTHIPQVFIHSPFQNDIFGIIPPYYNISIIEQHVESIWYTLDNGENNYTMDELSGYIDEEPWTNARNGPVTIRYYIKDLANQMNYTEVTVIKETIQLLDVDMIDQSFSLDEFNFTIFVYNELGDGIDFASIQMWWNSIDVSTDVINLGNGFYFISLEPITVASEEDPILLNMIISADGYEDKHFETYLAVDPDTLSKGGGTITKEFPLTMVIIIIISVVGGIAVIGVALVILRKRKGASEI